MVTSIKTQSDFEPKNQPGLQLFAADITNPHSVSAVNMRRSVSGFEDAVWAFKNTNQHMKCFKATQPYDLAGLVSSGRLIFVGTVIHLFDAGGEWFHKQIWPPSPHPGIYGRYPIVMRRIDIDLDLLPNVVSCLKTRHGAPWDQHTFLHGAMYFEYDRAKALIDAVLASRV